MFKKSAFFYLLSSLTLSLTVNVASVMAQSNLNLNIINGLFTPTQSQRFFEIGRERFKTEVEILTHPEKYLEHDLLKIEPAAIIQMKTFYPSSKFKFDSWQWELSSPRINH